MSEIDPTLKAALDRIVPIIGDTPRLRIVSTLILAEADLNMTELLERSGVSRGGIYNNLDDLVDEGAVEETRKVGQSQFYTANADHPVIADLVPLLESDQ